MATEVAVLFICIGLVTLLLPEQVMKLDRHMRTWDTNTNSGELEFDKPWRIINHSTGFLSTLFGLFTLFDIL